MNFKLELSNEKDITLLILIIKSNINKKRTQQFFFCLFMYTKVILL